ncbi:muts domain V-domain-containing protein [Thelephora terrestris]|uniref:Muts domain V-domain-containing protein n=1 Tax=Thelephora terrestris TaxID=56493 RepID=A0A9P6L3W5_9AGAM|nr:muts domain V-domain-containing protein [Thelephora terrestris]
MSRRPTTVPATTPVLRPASARPQTAASSRPEGHSIVALLEGRGVTREIGMATLNPETGRATMVQLSDLPTYVKTLHQMHIHYPSLVLVPDTFLSPHFSSDAKASLLINSIEGEFEDVPIEPVKRKYWNETVGLQFITQLALDDEERASTLLSASTKYYALSALCAIFKYSEMKLNIRYSAGSLSIRYTPVEGTMLIDPETIRNLELVGNMGNRKSNHSLFGVMNHTFTPMAARLLKANIISPITTEKSINDRLDAVEELIRSEDMFNEVRSALKMLAKHDLDKLIASFIASDPQTQAKSSTPIITRITQMLQLRNIVRNLPDLQDSLSCASSMLLQIISVTVWKMISDKRIEAIDSLIVSGLNEENVQSPPRTGIGAVTVRVFAVKANFNRLLDVARETFKENVADIYELGRELSGTHGLPLALVYQDSGFVFQLKKLEVGGGLPAEFINVTEKKGRIVFSTLDLKKRNARMKDALDEVMSLSDKLFPPPCLLSRNTLTHLCRIIRDLIGSIVSHIGALYKASEAVSLLLYACGKFDQSRAKVALLDMLVSFAHASIVQNCVRPEFTGTLAVKAGRHPILSIIKTAGALVPNDTYCCDSSSFQLVRGPKLRKSTYLRQVGLLTIMGMCGCFVPAEYASFRAHDSLLTRLSNDDDMEKSLSTFANEMASCAMILGLATPRSLVLMDEVGRGTSPEEGVGIAHAVAETLIKSRCFVLFTTHFHELSLSLSRQPTVVNMHLSVQVREVVPPPAGSTCPDSSQSARPSGSKLGLVFNHRIMDGEMGNVGHYGLQLAKLADLPNDVLSEAARVTELLEEQHSVNKASSEAGRIAQRRKLFLRLRTQLTQAAEHSMLPDRELLDYFSRIQRETVATLRSTLSP